MKKTYMISVTEDQMDIEIMDSGVIDISDLVYISVQILQDAQTYLDEEGLIRFKAMLTDDLILND